MLEFCKLLDRRVVLLKMLISMICILPLVRIYQRVAAGSKNPDFIHILGKDTGEEAIFLLILTLAITPLRRLVPRLSWLIGVRRLLGLFSFFYASMHMLVYVVVYARFSIGTILHEIAKRRYILVGLAAWSLLMPLAATSTRRSIRNLGAGRWRAIHNMVYAASIAAIAHFWLSIKDGEAKPVRATILLAVVLGIRPVQLWWRARHTRILRKTAQ